MNSKKSLLISIFSTLFLVSLSLFLVYFNLQNKNNLNKKSPSSIIEENVMVNNDDKVAMTPETFLQEINTEGCEVIFTINPECGDGVKNGNEQCDDTDGVAANQVCSSECEIVDLAHCGDGIVDSGEQCDEGDNNNGEECEVEYGGTCTYCTTNCLEILITGPYCGDGTIDTSEICDDGDNNGEVCEASYGETCSYCSEECEEEEVEGSYCGDGVKNGDEECDGDEDRECENSNGDNGVQTCTDSCEWTICQIGTYCGDGDIQNPNDQGQEEECDEGSDNGEVCEASYGETCSYCSDECEETEEEGGSCGDGELDEDEEECDDGNDDNDDGCKEDCTLPECTGDVPSNSTMCEDDNEDLDEDTSRKLVNNCTDDRKCEYKCNSDYNLVDGKCVEKTDPAKPALPKAGGIPPTLIFTLGGIALVILGLLF